MATATATMPLHPFKKDTDTSGEDQIGLSLSPSPSPHTTLTPVDAAVLASQAKGINVNGTTCESTDRLPVDRVEPALLPRPPKNMDNFLSGGNNHIAKNVVSHDGMNGSLLGDTIDASNNRDNNDNNNNNNNSAEAPAEGSKERKLEARIVQLEQSLASLMEVCNGLLKQQQQQQVRNDCFDEYVRELVKKLVDEELKKIGLCRQSTPTTPLSATPPHRRFDTETEALSQWPPTQQPFLDSPEVSLRRRKHNLSSSKDDHRPKPSKTMSMLLLDIAPGENRGPSMIPFTQDLDESGDSGPERAMSSNSSQSGGESDEGCGRLAKESPPTPPMLNEMVEQTTAIKGDSATPSPESSSNGSSPSSRRESSLHSSLKIDTPQESNLECQAYTSSHLEALRLRREAGKVRAYSFNDSLANTPESSYRKHLEQKSASKAERKMPTISSPVLETPVFDVLKPDDKSNELTESVDTFVQVMCPVEENNKELLVPILSMGNIGNERKGSAPAISRKDSNASHVSLKSSKSSELQLTSGTTLTTLSKSETKNSNQSLSSLRKSANNLSGRERSRSTVSEKEDAASTTSIAVTVKNNNTVKSSEDKPIKESSTDVKGKQTMKEYIMNDLFNIDSQHQDGSATEDIDANMEEFLRVPFKLENLMFFSLAVCVDSFLYVWTMLPLKVIWGFVCLMCTMLRPGTGIKGIQFHRRHLYALLQCMLVWFVFYHVLRPISIGKLYHWIRGQAMLKLYVLIAIVEVFDRLLCSFGQDAWDSLYWNTTRRPRHPRMLVSMIVVGVYVTIHSLFLFVHVATLSVAVNSADNALLTLLISGNFAEIKSTVFKKYNKQNLFKITTSDICERFKLALFLSLILLLNCFQGEMSKSMVIDYYTMCTIVMVAEFISDWIKHSFITKFNFIKSTAYFDYALILSGDVTGIGHEGLNLDYTHAAVKRLGLAQIPLVCVTARYLHEATRFAIAFRGNGDVDHPMNALSEFLADGNMTKFYIGIFAFMVALVGFKILLGVCIRFVARHNLCGDVIEMIEKKKSSSKKLTTPKPTTGKNEVKKNQ